MFGVDNTVVATQATGSWLPIGKCANYNLQPYPGVSYSYFAGICVGANCPASLYVETGVGSMYAGQ